MKYFSSLATTLIVVLSSLLFVACDKANDDPFNYQPPRKGVYKVEISVTGDLEGFIPYIFVTPTYSPGDLEMNLYDEHNKLISNLGGYEFDYEDNPEAYSKTIVCSTTNKASGMLVWLWSQNPNMLTNQEPHPIKVVFKGYLNNKLIKERVQEIDGLHPVSGIHQAIFLIGEDKMGNTEG